MKKVFLSAVSLATMAGSAFAADLPSRKEPVVAPVVAPMWTGFYAGLNAGYNFGTNSNVYSQNWSAPYNLTNDGRAVNESFVSVAPIAMDGSRGNTQSGFIGGAQFGYNYQMGSYLIGVETDIQGTNTRGTARTSGLTAQNVNVTGDLIFGGQRVPFTGSANENTVGSSVIQGGVDYIGTIRGRVGYLFMPTLLVYGTGGFAYGGAWANVAQSAISTGSATQTALGIAQTFPTTGTWIGSGQQNQLLTGWTAGGGAEWMFMPNWSLKGEALYWDLGRMDVQTSAFTNAIPANIAWGRTSVNYSGVMARAGINYHFNWGAAPIVAKF